MFLKDHDSILIYYNKFRDGMDLMEGFLPFELFIEVDFEKFD